MTIVRDASGNSPKSLDGVGIDPGNPPMKEFDGAVRANSNLLATLTAQNTLTMRELFGDTASGKYRISTAVAIRFNTGASPTTPTSIAGTRMAAGEQLIINMRPTDKLAYIVESATGSATISEIAMVN